MLNKRNQRVLHTAQIEPASLAEIGDMSSSFPSSGTSVAPCALIGLGNTERPPCLQDVIAELPVVEET